jgi:hypothetical protein
MVTRSTPSTAAAPDSLGVEILQRGAEWVSHPRLTSSVVAFAAAVAGFAAYPALLGAAPEKAVTPRVVAPSEQVNHGPLPLTYGTRTPTGRLCEVSYQSGLPTEADCFESDAALRRWLTWGGSRPDPPTTAR